MDLPNPRGSGGGSFVVIQQPCPDRESPSSATILSLDQIKAIRGNNEYTEGPSAALKKPGPRLAPRPEKPERTHEIIPLSMSNSAPAPAASEQRPPGHSRAPVLSRSTSTGSAASSGSNSSVSSEQGLLGRSPPSRPADRAIRAQPKRASSAGGGGGTDDLKGPAKGEPDVAAAQHKFICERCGKCKCGECTAPRALPSCLACDRQCLCSAESMVEYGTCMCLVKGLFYHCSNDDEGDSCADHPCSCSQAHCCSRYLCMGTLALCLPCLLCYPPAHGCLKLGRGCYDRATRPGCRCKNSNTVYRKLESGPSRGQGKPS